MSHVHVLLFYYTQGAEKARSRVAGKYVEESEISAVTYKTEICRSHFLNGFCEYESRCQYAHGFGQLRARNFDEKYKTEACRLWHGGLDCPFLSRCKFIHDEYRIQASAYEFWLVSPAEKIVRIEIVSPSDMSRLKLLQDLSQQPQSLTYESSMVDAGMIVASPESGSSATPDSASTPQTTSARAASDPSAATCAQKS